MLLIKRSSRRTVINPFEIDAWFTSLMDRWVSGLQCRDTGVKVHMVIREHLHWAWPTREPHKYLLTLSGLLDAAVVWVIFWPAVPLAIHSEATRFNCIFSWSLAIWILTLYVGFSRFKFAVWSRMHLNKIYRSW